MKCLNILMAAAALLGCLATAINGATPQDLSVPFNDLLPPLLDAEETAGGAASAVAAVVVPSAAPTTTAKPTATKTTAAKTTATKTTAATVAKFSKAATAKKKSRYQEQTQHIKELHLIDDDAVVQHDYKQQQQQQLQAAQKLQQQKLAPAKQQKQQKPLPQQQQPEQRRAPTAGARFKQPHQYVDYFQSTTARSPRGSLPTLTPFPRHLK